MTKIIMNNPSIWLRPSSLHLVSWAHASWLIQRGTAILIAPCVFLGNISVLSILVILASFHLYIGVTEILTDYIHHEVTRLLFNILFSFLVLIFLKESLMILAFI
jgi:succinate dehydrogenase hydrophobic anchor subunit